MRVAISFILIGTLALALLLAGDSGGPGEQGRLLAGEPAANDEDGFDQLTEHVPQYVLQSETGRTEAFQLAKEPVLRWTNPVRKTRDGATFLWLADSRPAAVLCAFWSGEHRVKHELHSLHGGPIAGKFANETVWKTREAGIDFHAVPGPRQVAENERVRLVQMRQIASQYQGRIVPSRRPPEQLRLLSQPLYRYDGRDHSPELIDGAIFAFVQTTDPEILVLLEARKGSADTEIWHVAFARMSRWPLQVRRRSEVVWSCEWGEGSINEPYRILSHQVETE